MVSALFAAHDGDSGALIGDTYLAFKADREALLTAHGWDPEFFMEKIEDYNSDFEVTE
jgi:hypothetical protein